MSGVGKSARSLSDIHAGFGSSFVCVSLIVSVSNIFITFLYVYIHCTSLVVFVPSLSTIRLVGILPIRTLIELAEPPLTCGTYSGSRGLMHIELTIWLLALEFSSQLLRVL